jgi:mono/diheme cytochrome c family protein
MLLILGMVVALGGCSKEATQTTQKDNEPAPTAGPAPGSNTAGQGTGQTTGSAMGQATGTADNGTPAANSGGQAAGTPAANTGGQAGTPAAAGGASEEARNLYTMRCAICHGQNGKGDGAGAASLNPKPRDYTNKEWQASVTDEDLKKIIIGGGQSVGKSPIMPPNPDLGQKPEVLDGIIAVIRGFGK